MREAPGNIIREVPGNRMGEVRGVVGEEKEMELDGLRGGAAKMMMMDDKEEAGHKEMNEGV